MDPRYRDYISLMEELGAPTLPTFPGLLRQCTLPGVLLFLFFGGIFLVLYIYYVNSSTSGIQRVNHQRRRFKVIDAINPFSCKVDYASASFHGVKCTLRCSKECHVQAFWGAPIYPLVMLLHKDCQVIRNAITSHILYEKFSSKCAYANEPLVLSAGEKRTIEFRVPEHIDESVLSQATANLRQAYPFVILMVFTEDINDLPLIAMATAVHIPDRSLRINPQLIGQYVKLSSGSVRHTAKIYLSSAPSGEGGEGPHLCVACFHRPVSVVFLPCRHACVCNTCFELCQRCPVCRAPSNAYFQLPEDYLPTDVLTSVGS